MKLSGEKMHRCLYHQNGARFVGSRTARRYNTSQGGMKKISEKKSKR